MKHLTCIKHSSQKNDFRGVNKQAELISERHKLRLNRQPKKKDILIMKSNVFLFLVKFIVISCHSLNKSEKLLECLFIDSK